MGTQGTESHVNEWEVRRRRLQGEGEVEERKEGAKCLSISMERARKERLSFRAGPALVAQVVQVTEDDEGQQRLLGRQQPPQARNRRASAEPAVLPITQGPSKRPRPRRWQRYNQICTPPSCRASPPVTFLVPGQSPSDEYPHRRSVFFFKRQSLTAGLAFLKNHLYREGRISVVHAMWIIEKATAILRVEPNVLQVDPPLLCFNLLCGNIHGQYVRGGGSLYWALRIDR